MKTKDTFMQRIGEYLFTVAVVIEVLVVIVDKSNYTNPVQGRLFQLTFLLFLAKVCLTKYTFREYVCIFFFCILGAVSYFVTGRNELVRVAIFVAACKNIDMHKCLKLVFWLTLSGCLSIIILSVTGIYGRVSLTQDFGRGSVETRYTLGMGHPNALQCMVWSLSVLGLYLYGKMMRWWHYLVLLLVNVFFYFLTDSRTSLLVTVLAIVIALAAMRQKSVLVGKLLNWFGMITSLGSIGISILIACNAYRVYDYVWYDDRSPVTMLFYYLNRALNGRVRILVENDRFEGTVQTWRLFSRPENNYFFDLGWVRLFYWYGIIPGCVLALAIAAMLVFFYKKNDYLAIALIASISLYTVIEAHVISVYLARNYLLFLAGGAWCMMLKGSEWKGVTDRERKESYGANN